MKVETSIDDASGVSWREFIKRSSAVAGAGVVSGGALLAASSDGWAQLLTSFDVATGKALLQMCRDLYLHDRVPDAMCRRWSTWSTPGRRRMPRWRSRWPKAWRASTQQRDGSRSRTTRPPRARPTALRALRTAYSGTPFFAKVCGDMIAGLYNNPDVWEILGYEGASAHLGGYINRGFNDIDWL